WCAWTTRARTCRRWTRSTRSRAAAAPTVRSSPPTFRSPTTSASPASSTEVDVIQTPAGFRVEDLPAPLEWLELALPDGWSRAPGPEEDVLVFGQGHLVMRVRV